MPSEECNGLDVRFCVDAAKARQALPPQERVLSLSELLVGFFHYWGHVHNPTKDCISIRSASIIHKKVRPLHSLEGLGAGTRTLSG